MKRSLTIVCFYFCSAIVSSQTLQSKTAIVSLKSIDPGIRFKDDERVLYSPGLVEEWMKNKKPSKAALDYSHQNREVEAYYFPGSSDKKALIIAGMHGSELSAIEVAKNLVQLLSSGEMPYYNVIIIPELFPITHGKQQRWQQKVDPISEDIQLKEVLTPIVKCQH